VVETPGVTALLGRALELLRRGERGPQLEQLVKTDIVGALGDRLGDRDLYIVGRVEEPDGAPVVDVGGRELAPGRLLIVLAPNGEAADVRLDLRGGRVPETLSHVPTSITYRAGELPSDHRWWSDVGGLLMVGELAAMDA